jgi:hypothetical protein
LRYKHGYLVAGIIMLLALRGNIPTCIITEGKTCDIVYAHEAYDYHCILALRGIWSLSRNGYAFLVRNACSKHRPHPLARQQKGDGESLLMYQHLPTSCKILYL